MGEPSPRTRPRDPSASAAPWLVPAMVGGIVVLGAMSSVDQAISVIAWALVVIFVAFFLRHLAFAISAMRSAPPDLHAPAIDTGYLPPVSVLVACKNEAVVIDHLIDGLLALDYPRHRLQIIVVDDGSHDATAARLAARAATSHELHWIAREKAAGGGKSGALNAALEHATGEVIVVFDADHRPRPDVLRRLVGHFADPMVAAAQGRCVIHNASDGLLARLVRIDYLAGYLVNEFGRQSLFRLPAYGGANCAVRASSLRALGGWSTSTVTEDTDLTLRLVLAGARVRYDVNAVDEEEGVITLARFWRQRYRWARGHQQACRDYRASVWRSPRMSPVRKMETTMFLFAFHLPVASALGLVILGVWLIGLAEPSSPTDAFVLWTLLFLGPLLELGGGLLVAQADRRDALCLAYFLPVFFVCVAVCTKAWLDGVAGRPYSWAKTARAADPVGTR